MANADYFRFPQLKTPMKGKLFATIKEIKEKSKQELLAISESAFQNCFEDCKNAGISVLYLRRVHCEGDKIVIDSVADV